MRSKLSFFDRFSIRVTVTWVLVADRADARFYEYRRKREGLQLIREIENPEARLKERDLDLS